MYSSCKINDFTGSERSTGTERGCCVVVEGGCASRRCHDNGYSDNRSYTMSNRICSVNLILSSPYLTSSFHPCNLGLIVSQSFVRTTVLILALSFIYLENCLT